jgi:hypothetical protein
MGVGCCEIGVGGIFEGSQEGNWKIIDWEKD